MLSANTRGRTKLPNGRTSLLVDLGSRINLVGDKTLEEDFKQVAAKYGLDIAMQRRPNRLHVSGVGAGTVPCDEQATIPIAVRYQDTVQYDSFVANVAQNSSLPAILGARSMQEKDAIILLREGAEKLIFPGAGGYSLELAEDAKVMPITPSASGHYLISCDHFDQAAKHHDSKGKGYGQQTVFIIDHKNTKSYTEAREVLDDLAEASGEPDRYYYEAAAHVKVSPPEAAEPAAASASASSSS